MQCKCENSTQVTMVLSHDFVLLQVPALDLFVLSCREQVWVALRDCNSPDSVDMPCQSDHQLATCEVPKLDSPVTRSRDEELVHRVDGQAPDPAVVASYDSLKLPRSVPLRLDYATLAQNYGVSIER